jgi:hypothetical protein
MTMPFGNYQGHSLTALPPAYLVWLTSRDLPSPLRTALEQEILRRFGLASANGRKVKARPLSDVAESLIEAGRRSLARRSHPDVGGSHEEMLHVNDAADWLREQVRRAA